MKPEPAEIEALLVDETNKAWLLDVGNDDPVWFPKSLCMFDGETLILPEYLAIEKEVV